MVSEGQNPADSTTYSEAERKATLAKNQEILAKLDLSNPILSLPSKTKTKTSSPKAKPVQPAKKKVKREASPIRPTRQSARLRRSTQVDSNETPTQKRKREVRRESAFQTGAPC